MPIPFSSAAASHLSLPHNQTPLPLLPLLSLPPSWLKYTIKATNYWQNVTGVKKATDGLYVKDGLVPGSLHPMRERPRGQRGGRAARRRRPEAAVGT
jgi:hypothetical protein